MLIAPESVGNIHIQNFVSKIHDQKLERVRKYKYLGIIFNEKLSWKAHISYLFKKLSKTAEIFYKLRTLVNKKKNLIQVYYALVHSKLMYGILSWGRAYTTTIKPLIVLMNRVIRAIYKNCSRYDAVFPLHNNLKLLQIPELCKVELLIIQYCLATLIIILIL